MGDSPRRWFRFRIRTMLLLTLLAVIGLSVYSYWSDYRDEAIRRERELLSPQQGDVCEVVLRADALGLEKMPPSFGSVNGAENYVRGRFVSMNDQWIVLSQYPEDKYPEDDAAYWVRRENVLLIRVSPP